MGRKKGKTSMKQETATSFSIFLFFSFLFEIWKWQSMCMYVLIVKKCEIRLLVVCLSLWSSEITMERDDYEMPERPKKLIKFS